MQDKKNFIAKRVARELRPDTVVNLGIGIPTLVANYIPKDMHVILQSENGILGISEAPPAGAEDPDIFNAGGFYVTAVPQAWFCDSATAFAIVRRGKIDLTVLGALQVDCYGNIASWVIPGKRIPGMGGSMDMVAGAKRVIVAMLHTENGNSKILEKCTYPLTGAGVVDLIITEMGVMEVTANGLLLREIAPGVTIEKIQAATETKLILSDALTIMQ